MEATAKNIRDCMTFKMKFGVYPDKLILNKETLENWKTRQNEETEGIDYDTDSAFEAIPGNIVEDGGNASIKTDFLK